MSERICESERICVAVGELRKRYNDKTMTLEKWLNNSENVYVGRKGRIWITENGTKRIFHYPGSVWKNEFTVKEHGLENCLVLYREELLKKLNDKELNIEELRNKKLGCFCKPDEKCHVDILIELLKDIENKKTKKIAKRKTVKVQKVYPSEPFLYEKTFDDFENKPEFKSKCVNSVTFDISRYGEYTKTIVFDELQTQEYALKQVEKYLSEPVTEDYFKMYNEGDYDREDVAMKGDLLGACIYLELLKQKGNHLTIICGS